MVESEEVTSRGAIGHTGGVVSSELDRAYSGKVEGSSTTRRALSERARVFSRFMSAIAQMLKCQLEGDFR